MDRIRKAAILEATTNEASPATSTISAGVNQQRKKTRNKYCDNASNIITEILIT